jgi:hypothetical protein
MKLEAEWQRGPVMVWTFQRVTRVHQFEVRGEVGHNMVSLVVGVRENLIGPVPLAELGEDRMPIILDVQRIGTALLVVVDSNRVELRPIGEQVL